MENIQPIFFFIQKKEETKNVKKKNQNYDQAENRGKYSKVKMVRAERNNYFHRLKRMKIKLL